MRILSLGPQYDGVRQWQQSVVSIRTLVIDWELKSLYAQLSWLIRHANEFDVILIYRNVRLATLFGLARRVWQLRPSLIHQELYFDLRSAGTAAPSWSFRVRRRVSLGLYALMVRIMDAIIVHTSAEVNIYADLFGVHASRFRFVPYFAYRDAATHFAVPAEAAGYILAPGRHRDFGCFIRAVANLPWPAKIVAGDSDRAELAYALPPNVSVDYEVSWKDYRDLMANAALVVIPLSADYWQRALGQIALLEAWMMQKPVVAARTFQLADYAGEDDLLYYTPGNFSELKQKIALLMQDSTLRDQLLANGYRRASREFTIERYAGSLLQICAELTSGAALSSPKDAA